MSPTTGSARPPAASICAAAVYTVPSSAGCGSAVLAISATLAPSRAARSAMARPMPRLPPEMNKVLPASVIDALLEAGPGRNATARSAPFLKAFLPERSVVPLSRQPGASARLRALPQALPRRLHLGLGGDAVGPRRIPHALARLELLVDGEEVVDLQPVELRDVLQLAQ